MKKVLISIFLGALMLGVVAAQGSAPPPGPPASEPQTSTPAQAAQQPAPQPSTQAPQAQTPQSNAGSNPADAPKRIAPGSVIPVSLEKTVDAKKAKTGDEVVAKVTQDMKNNTGEVLVPKDTKVVGHVTEAQPRSKEQKESEIGIAFDRAVMKNGSEMQMPMSIQAIIGSQNNGSQSDQTGGGYGTAPGAAAGGNSNAGRAGGMGGSPQASAPQPSPGAGTVPSDTQGKTNARPPITAQTEGVVGISDLKLTTAAPTANQGSLVTSEKNNVKLESGTLMLLRVNQ
jgi:hypothetical protein